MVDAEHRLLADCRLIVQFYHIKLRVFIVKMRFNIVLFLIGFTKPYNETFPVITGQEDIPHGIISFIQPSKLKKFTFFSAISICFIFRFINILSSSMVSYSSTHLHFNCNLIITLNYISKKRIKNHISYPVSFLIDSCFIWYRHVIWFFKDNFSRGDEKSRNNY